MASLYLVTGGAGFIGSNLVRHLLAQGERVRVLDNFSTGRRENLQGLTGPIECVEGDLRAEADVRQAVAGVRYVLLLAAREAGVERLVFSSSSSVYGNTPVLPKQEDMIPTPLSPYALSKLAGEHYGRLFFELYGLRTFILRYFNVFGPRQNPKSQYAAVIPLFLDALRAGQPPVIFGDGEQTRDFTYVDDVIAANLACCAAPDAAAGGVYNVAWGNRVSVNELARRIGQLLGREIPPVYQPARAGDVRDSQADATRARDRLGWRPQVPFEEGLRRTVAWFLEQGA